MRNGYDPVSLQWYKGKPYRVNAERQKSLNESRLLRMVNLDLMKNQDYNIIDGRKRDRHYAPKEMFSMARQKYELTLE